MVIIKVDFELRVIRLSYILNSLVNEDEKIIFLKNQVLMKVDLEGVSVWVELRVTVMNLLVIHTLT
jgi:hypothetical protein